MPVRAEAAHVGFLHVHIWREPPPPWAAPAVAGAVAVVAARHAQRAQQ
jgi:hypothetical protein